RLIENNLTDTATKEQIKELENILFVLIHLIAKYLDNISTIAGKFILQVFTKKYHLIAKESNQDRLDYYLFDLIEMLKSKDNNNTAIRIYYVFLSEIAESF